MREMLTRYTPRQCQPAKKVQMTGFKLLLMVCSAVQCIRVLRPLFSSKMVLSPVYSISDTTSCKELDRFHAILQRPHLCMQQLLHCLCFSLRLAFFFFSLGASLCFSSFCPRTWLNICLCRNEAAVSVYPRKNEQNNKALDSSMCLQSAYTGLYFITSTTLYMGDIRCYRPYCYIISKYMPALKMAGSEKHRW